MACECDSVDCVNVLLEYGASPLKTFKNETALMLSARKNHHLTLTACLEGFYSKMTADSFKLFSTL